MPELPEIETICRSLKNGIVGHIIMWTEVRNAKLRWPIDSTIISLHNRLVLNVQRRAKYIVLKLDNGFIIIHLGMSGSLKILHPPFPSPEKHDHIDLMISNGYIIRYSDPRRFGAWLWSDRLENSKILSTLGPEPLSDEFTGGWLFDKSRNKKRIIKPWLMDKTLLVGLGNIYVNESLFAASILPYRVANTLSEEESTVLAISIKRVLLDAIEYGGTTIKDFLQPNGQPGFFSQKLQVYGRCGKPCNLCRRPIKMTKHCQRSTFFCEYCQH